MENQKLISLILPTTDETFSLEETIDLIRKNVLNYNFQFLIVTSPKLTTNESRQVISKLQNLDRGSEIETFDQTKSRLGGAIQEAFLKARGEYTILMASDLETDPRVLPEMLKKMEEGYDIVATTRWQKGARFQGYNLIKLLFNYFFQLFFRWLYWTDLTDLTYAYRCYKTEIVKKIKWEEPGFPFLFETIIKPIRLGYKVAEVKASWHARKEGVSHASAREIISYFKLGIKVRFASKSGLC